MLNKSSTKDTLQRQWIKQSIESFLMTTPISSVTKYITQCLECQLKKEIVLFQLKGKAKSFIYVYNYLPKQFLIHQTVFYTSKNGI